MGSELLRVAEGFSIVAEGLRGLAKAEGIRALMAQKTQEGKSKEIKELLQKYGAAKLSAVKPEDYPALMQEAQVL